MEEDEIEMTREEFQMWIREKVNSMDLISPDVLDKCDQLQSLLKRREEQVTNLVKLCESVTTCEAAVKKLYSMQQLEYRDTDSDVDCTTGSRNTSSPTCDSPHFETQESRPSAVPKQQDNEDNGKESCFSLDRKLVVVLTRLPKFKIDALCSPKPENEHSDHESFGSHTSSSDLEWEPEDNSSDSDPCFTNISNKRKKVYFESEDDSDDSDGISSFTSVTKKKRKRERQDDSSDSDFPSSRSSRKEKERKKNVKNNKKAAKNNFNPSAPQISANTERNATNSPTNTNTDASTNTAKTPSSANTVTKSNTAKTQSSANTDAKSNTAKTPSSANTDAKSNTAKTPSSANTTAKINPATTNADAKNNAKTSTSNTSSKLAKTNGSSSVCVVSTLCQSSDNDARAPPNLPQAKITVGMTVLARRKSLSWKWGKIIEIVKRDDGVLKYKVNFEEKGKVLVSGHHIAFQQVPKVDQLFIGARVVVKFPGDEPNFCPGILSELPTRKNRMRFLIFADDHRPIYVGLPLLHLVCRPLSDSLDDITDSMHQDFMRGYMQAWPCPPLTQYSVGRNIHVVLNGVQKRCEVVQVDCSLMQVVFEEDQHKEWVYRGSTRLEHMINMKEKLDSKKD